MAVYEIIWSRKRGQGRETASTAISALHWMAVFQDKGAQSIKVTRDGKLIEERELEALIQPETEANRGGQNA